MMFFLCWIGAGYHDAAITVFHVLSKAAALGFAVAGSSEPFRPQHVAIAYADHADMLFQNPEGGL